MRWENATKSPLPHLLPDAPVVVDELVGNVIRHARTESALRLELRPNGLSLAVTDGEPRLGTMPSSGGKVVWAVLPLR